MENCDKIANIFAGGGHKKASAFRCSGEFKEVIKLIITKIKLHAK